MAGAIYPGHDMRPKYRSGGPREKGPRSGRAKAIAVLDKVMRRPRNLKALERDLQRMFKKSPYLFFLNVSVPLTPKTMLETGVMGAGMGTTTLTPDNLVTLMDQSVVPGAKVVRQRLKEDKA